MNHIHFNHTLETYYYPINSIILRNKIWIESEANANSILDKEVKKDVQQGVYVMHLVHRRANILQQ